MKTQSTINVETLIPSSLLEEEHSDNESMSNNSFEEKNPLFKDASQKNISDNVNHIFLLFYNILQDEKDNNLEKHNTNQNIELKTNNKQDILLNDLQKPQKDDIQLNQSLDLNAFFKNSNEKEINFNNNIFFNSNPSIKNGIKGNIQINGTKKVNGIKEKKGINGNNYINGLNNINEKNIFNGINGFSNFDFTSQIKSDFKDNIDFLNNINLQNINLFNPSYININEINGNIGNIGFFQNQNHNQNLNPNNLINFNNNNIKNINNFNNNINHIKNINNIQNINNTNNINNVIFTNNFTNFNISPLDKNQILMINNLNKDINNISSINGQFFNNIFNNDKLNQINNLNIYNNINDDYFDNLKLDNYKSYKSLKDMDKNQNNIKNNSMLFFDRKKNNKKKSYLFQNETNKEKDIRDFKRFCDGIKSPLHDYICSQIGSRIMQKYLNRFPPFIITNLIEKINIYFEKIMCDIYGNYFSQKLYSISSIEQRRMILNSMKDIFINVSKNAAGAHVVQSIIELAETKEEKDIIMDYVKNHEMELALHPEGTHVLQKIVQIFAENERQHLTDILCTSINVNNLCQDLKGISVIKRLISFNKEVMNRVKLVDAFLPNVLEISKSSSGSYIIQFLIEQWGIDISLKIIHFCILNFEAFAINKHSANLINKIILICLKRNSMIRSYSSNSNNNINIMNCNEIIIINALKGIILEPNKVINVYKNKYGKALIIKIRNLFTNNENQKLQLFIKSLENTPNYSETKKYKIYIEIFESQ